jgi:hypothetical protein
MSNRYTVQVRLSYYANVEVEADSQDRAEDLALRQAHRAMEKGQGCWGEEPSVVEITNEGEVK